jgi:hypothetical protein
MKCCENSVENRIVMLYSSIFVNFVGSSQSSSLYRAAPTLGILWQIIKIQLLSAVTPSKHPELAFLMEKERNISEERLLLKWMNYHLSKDGSRYRVSNFGGDAMRVSHITLWFFLLHIS